MGTGRGNGKPVPGNKGGGAGAGRQLPGWAGQTERGSPAALPNSPAIKSRSAPASLPARFPSSGKCTSHFGFSLGCTVTVEGQNASLERAVEIKTTGMRQYAPEDDNSLLETQRIQRQSLAAGATEALRGVNAPWKHKDTVRRYRERYGALLRLQIRQTTRGNSSELRGREELTAGQEGV